MFSVTKNIEDMINNLVENEIINKRCGRVINKNIKNCLKDYYETNATRKYSNHLEKSNKKLKTKNYFLSLQNKKLKSIEKKYLKMIAEENDESSIDSTSDETYNTDTTDSTLSSLSSLYSSEEETPKVNELSQDEKIKIYYEIKQLYEETNNNTKKNTEPSFVYIVFRLFSLLFNIIKSVLYAYVIILSYDYIVYNIKCNNYEHMETFQHYTNNTYELVNPYYETMIEKITSFNYTLNYSEFMNLVEFEKTSNNYNEVLFPFYENNSKYIGNISYYSC